MLKNWRWWWNWACFRRRRPCCDASNPDGVYAERMKMPKILDATANKADVLDLGGMPKMDNWSGWPEEDDLQPPSTVQEA